MNIKFKEIIVIALCLFSACAIAAEPEWKAFVSGSRKIELELNSITYGSKEFNKTGYEIISYIVLTNNGDEKVMANFATRCGSSNKDNSSAVTASTTYKNGKPSANIEYADKYHFQYYNGRPLEVVQNYVCDITANYRGHIKNAADFSVNKEYNNVIKEYEMALAEAELLGFNENWQAETLKYIALSYNDQKEYMLAIEWLKKIYDLKLNNTSYKFWTDYVDKQIEVFLNKLKNM